MGRCLTMTAALAIASTAAGCGSEDSGDPRDKFPPAAEPADAPEPRREPVGSSVELGSPIEGLTVDARTGLAATITRDPVALALFDLGGERVRARAPLPAVGRHLQLAGPGGPVLVPSEGSDTLVTVSLPSGEAAEVPVGDFPHDATADGGRIFVANELGNTISVVEGGGVTETLESPIQPGGIVASGGYLAVIAVAERVLAVYDLQTLERLATVPAGTGPTHIVADGTRAFVADTEGGAVLEFRLGPEPEMVAGTQVRGAPYGIAIDPARDRLWVTLTAVNELVQYSIADGGLEESASYPTVRQPNTVAVDQESGDALVAGATGQGPLQRIRAGGG